MAKTNSSTVRKVKIPPNTPERPITFLTKKSANYTYVYVAANKFYDAVNQYQKNERKCIGRLDYKLEADWKEKNLRPSEMIPNERFAEYFPEYLLIDDTPADRKTESDPQRIPETDADDTLRRSDSVKVGQYLAINQIIEKYQIKEHLKSCFSNHADENETSNKPEEVINRILDYVAYMIIEEDKAAYHFENYAFEHALFGSPFSASAIEKLFASIDTDITNAFLNSWNAALIKENKRHETRIYVSAGGTNGPCEAGNIEFAETGAGSIDDGKPDWGIMLAVEWLNKLPVCYDVYYGSVNDVSESQYMAGILAALGYADIGFVLDRGFFSVGNIRLFEENGFAYLIMAKGSKPFIRTDFLSVINTFENETCNYIERFRVYGTTKETEIFGDGKKRHVHFYFNPAAVQSEQQAFLTRLNGWEKALEKKQAAKEKIDRRTMRSMEFFNIETNSENVILSYSRNTGEIDHELSLAGYFAIITNDHMTAEMALSIYKSRDVSEKLNLYKAFPGGWSCRFQDDEHLPGKAFVTFIAMIIRQSICLHLHDAAAKEGKEWAYSTGTMAISELGKISVTRLPNGKYALRRPLTQRQKCILSAFNISEKKAIEICSGKAEELNADAAEEA